MSFTFHCTHCNYLLEAEDDQEGIVCSCPNCQQAVTIRREENAVACVPVPTISLNASIGTAGAGESSAVPRRRRSRYIFARLYCRLARIIALLVLLSGIYFIYVKYTDTHESLEQYPRKIKQAQETYGQRLNDLSEQYAFTIQALTQPFTPTGVIQINRLNNTVEPVSQGAFQCQRGLQIPQQLTQFPDAFPDYLETTDEIQRARKALEAVGANVQTLKEKLKTEIFSYTPPVVPNTTTPARKRTRKSDSSFIKVSRTTGMDLFSTPPSVEKHWNQLSSYVTYALNNKVFCARLSNNEVKKYNVFFQWCNYIVSNLIRKNSTITMAGRGGNASQEDTEEDTEEDSAPKRPAPSTKEQLMQLIAYNVQNAPWAWTIDQSIGLLAQDCQEMSSTLEQYDHAKTAARKAFIIGTAFIVLYLVAIAFALLIVSDIITAHLDTADNSWTCNRQKED